MPSNFTLVHPTQLSSHAQLRPGLISGPPQYLARAGVFPEVEQADEVGSEQYESLVYCLFVLRVHELCPELVW